MALVFHQAALGDFVLTFPMLRALRQAGPVTVVSSWSKALLAARVVPGVKAISIEMFEFTRLHAPGGPSVLSPAVREVFEDEDQIVSFVAKPGEPWADNVARHCPGARLLFVEPRPPTGSPTHVEEWHRRQLAEQGVELVPQPPTPRSRSGPIVVHPGSGGLEKCWDARRFEHVIDALRREGRDVRPVLGEAEAERWPADQVRRWQSELGATLLRDLLELHALLDTASLYLGNDSGPTHLAAQMGLRTVALFGPSDPRQWAPRGPHVTTLAPPTPSPMDWLDPATVLAMLRPLAA